MAGVLVENAHITGIAEFDNPRRSLQDAHATFFDVLVPCCRNSGISPILCTMRLDDSAERGDIQAGTYSLLATARTSTLFRLTWTDSLNQIVPFIVGMHPPSMFRPDIRFTFMGDIIEVRHIYMALRRFYNDPTTLIPALPDARQTA
jgi:hypothetical protein